MTRGYVTTVAATLVVVGWAVSVDAAAEVPAATPTAIRSWTGRLAAGNSHTCMIRNDGTVFCWGDNTYGQLGNSAFPDATSTSPVAVASLGGARTAVQITAGANHSCAGASDGSVWCWGYSGFLEMGSAVGNQSDPFQISLGVSLDSVRVIAGGNNTCAFTTDDNLTCWGRNNKGQIGNGATKASGGVAPTAVNLVPSSFTVRDVDPGGSHMCAASDSGAVWCWGADAKKQLGTAADGATDKYTPTLTDSTGGPVRSVATGNDFSCAVRGTGVVVCWGDNTYGQLAQSLSTTSNATPTVVSLSSRVTKVAAGGTHACALTSQGELWCWGRNNLGQAGDGTPDATKTTPVKVVSLGAEAVDVSAGLNHTCAMLITAVVKCWGSNSAGQIGAADGQDHATPVTVAGLDESATAGSLSATSVSSSTATVSGSVSVPVGEASYSVERSTTAGFATVAETAALGSWGRAVVASTSQGHGCVVLAAGTVSCRGSNSDGQLGNGTNLDSADPVNVSLGVRAVLVSTGGRHACAIASTGSVWCWGANDTGQLGDGTGTASNTPVAVPLDTGESAIDVEAGETSTCALLDTGVVRCWGSNGSGELGNGTMTPTASIVTVPLGEAAVGVSVGGLRACAVLVSGNAKCWGAGRPGDGSEGGSATPVYAALTSSTVRQVVTGSGHSCALVVGGDVKCWGSDATVDTVSPVAVSFGAGAHVTALAASGAATCALLATGAFSCVGEAGDARTRATHALDPSTAPSHSVRSLSRVFSGLPDATPQWYRFVVSHGGTVVRTAAATFTTDTTTTTTTATTTVPESTTTVASSSTDPTTTSSSPMSSTIVSTSTTSTTVPVVAEAIPSPALPSVAGLSLAAPPRPDVHVLVARAGRSVSAARIASAVGLHIPRSSVGKLRVSIVSGLSHCTFVGSAVHVRRSGHCSLRVQLIRKVGRTDSALLTLRIARG